MRRMTLSALALVASLGVAGVARAGCCDDFWSCAAAVATGGLTCQIQSIIDTVNSLKTMVETLGNSLRTQTNTIVTQAQRAVTDATNDLKQLREQAMADLQRQAEKAHELANPPKAIALAPAGIGLQNGGGVAKTANMPPGASMQAAPALALNKNAVAPPKQGDAQAIKDALTRADAFMQDLRSKANQPAADVARAEQAALAAAAQHVHTALQISLDLALTPLNLVKDSLLDLLTHPERIFDPTAQIDADIQRITAQVPPMLDRITNEVTQEAMADLDRVKGTLQQVHDSAAAGQSIVDSMQRLANSKLQSDLDALDHLVPRPPPGVSLASRGIILPTTGFVSNKQVIAAALTRAEPAKLPIVIQHRAAVNDIAAKWQSIKLSIKAPVHIEPAQVQKVDGDLQQMFNGKGRADIDKKKTELLAEAQKRFASDPKTLEKVRQYIESHTPKG